MEPGFSLINPDLQVGVKASLISDTISMVSQPHVIWQFSATASNKHSNGARSETIKMVPFILRAAYPDLKGRGMRGILQET
jgi:hypothetical protein